MKRIISAMALAGYLAIGSAANAAVTFDPATGTGFAGKGDVQLVFGWNKSELESNATDVTFSYIVTQSYDAVCTWTTGDGTRGETTHNVTHHTMITGVNDAVTSDLIKNNQSNVTGFNLTGFGAINESIEVPIIGSACPGKPGTEGTWTSVTQTSARGGLYATYGASTLPILVIQ